MPSWRNATTTCASSACSTTATTTARPPRWRAARSSASVDDLVEFARRTRIDLVIFSLPISAEGRILQMLKKLWVLPVDIRLAAHSNKLRFRPRAYSYIGNVPVLDVFDKPITDWDVVTKMAVRPLHRRHSAPARVPGHAAGGDRHQARQPRPGVLQAEALRLQQRADRGLQVPLDVCRPVRRHRLGAGDQGRSARHPGRRLPAQDLDRRAAAAHQRGAQGQPVAGRARARTRSSPRPRTGSTTRPSTAISPATGSSPGSPAGRRSTAGAARPTPRRRFSAASSTTSTTSRTGRCCSTSTSWRRRRLRCFNARNAY